MRAKLRMFRRYERCQSNIIYLGCFFLNMFGRELNLDLSVLDTLKDSIELLSSCLE